MIYIGYARVSSRGQSLEVQLGKLKQCKKIFKEKRSGTTDQRPKLKSCLGYLKEGDTLVVTRLDRLARSTFHLCQIADKLEQKKVHLQVIDQKIDTSTASGRLLFNMLGVIAQFETEIRAERQLDGIMKAKELGVPIIYLRLLLLNNSKFFSLTIPRSITQIRCAIPYFSSMPLTISSTVLLSWVLPENISYPRGRPSRVTTNPIHICLQSPRLSRE